MWLVLVFSGYFRDFNPKAQKTCLSDTISTFFVISLYIIQQDFVTFWRWKVINIFGLSVLNLLRKQQQQNLKDKYHWINQSCFFEICKIPRKILNSGDLGFFSFKPRPFQRDMKIFFAILSQFIYHISNMI